MDTVRDIDLGIDGIGMRVIRPLSLQEPGEVPGSHVQTKNNIHGMRTQVPCDTEPEGRCAHAQHQTRPRETETNVPRECDETRYIHRQQHGFKEKWRSQWQSVKGWDAAKIRTNQSYDNEAYDQDSSQGSEKSLIRRSSDSPSKMDSCIEMDHEPFTNRDGTEPAPGPSVYGEQAERRVTLLLLGHRPGLTRPWVIVQGPTRPLDWHSARKPHSICRITPTATHKKVLLHKG